MAFTNDQAILNGVNLDLVNQYQQYMNALQPLLMDQSGYTKVTSPDNISQQTKDALSGAQNELDIYNRGRAGNLSSPDEVTKFGQIIQKYYGGSPSNSNQWNDADANIRNQIGQVISSTQNKANNEQVSYAMTPEAKANQDAYKKLAATQLQQLQQQADYLNSDAYKQQVAQQQQISDYQQKNTLALMQRQQDALAGKIGTSPVLQKQINDAFQQFKEAQGKAGNIILGDSVDNAVGKGSAGTEALARFQDNVAAMKQRETESIINQTPLSLASAEASSSLLSGLNLGNTGQYASTTFNQAYGTPQSVNYSGLSGLVSSAQQPYQFDASMYMQQQQMNNALQQQAAQRQSGLLSGAMQLGGTLLGAYLGGPVGAQIGQQVGQAGANQLSPSGRNATSGPYSA